MLTRSEILKRADEIVNGHRENEYGSPEDNFKLISKFWSLYLGYPVDPVDVAAMMILQKLARATNDTSYLDNWVDICGYSACGGEIATKETEAVLDD